MTEPDSQPEVDHEALSSLEAVRGLGEERIPDQDAHERAAQLDPAEWDGMMGPDDDPNQ